MARRGTCGLRRDGSSRRGWSGPNPRRGAGEDLLSSLDWDEGESGNESLARGFIDCHEQIPK